MTEFSQWNGGGSDVPITFSPGHVLRRDDGGATRQKRLVPESLDLEKLPANQKPPVPVYMETNYLSSHGVLRVYYSK